MLLLLQLLLSIKAYAGVIELPVGKSFKITTTINEDIRVRGKKHIQIKETSDGVLIIGKAAGQASISVSDRNFQFQILEHNDLNFLNSLKRKIMSMPNMRLEYDHSGITLIGHFYRFDDWLELSKIASIHDSTFSLRVSLDPDVELAASKYFLKRCQESQLAQPLMQWEPFAQIRLAKESEKSISLWKEIFTPFGIQIIFDANLLKQEPLVRVKILVAEVSRSFSQNLGIAWPTQIKAEISPKLRSTENLEASLNLAEDAGEAQILASPNLVARSGGEAEFLAGGEFPIRIMNFKQKEVVWKRHGILLKLKPLADPSGYLKLELTTEVSMLDGDNKVDGLPQMKTSRITSQFDMLAGKTIILSGLLQNSLGEEASGLIGLRRLPILGRLFESRNFHNNQSELVIFVTPEILNSQISNKIELPNGFKNARE